MNFREAMTQAVTQAYPTLRGDGRAAADRLTRRNHPLLWRALESYVTHHYEADTGESVGAGFDWSKVIPWLLDNLPKILAIILPLFM